MKCLQLIFVALLSFNCSQALSKSYSTDYTGLYIYSLSNCYINANPVRLLSADLLDLEDNDEFVWGAAENKQYSRTNASAEQANDNDNAGITNFLARHRLSKRQADNAAPILVSCLTIFSTT